VDERIALEMAVAGELTQLRLIERALHDRAVRWGIAVGRKVFPARVAVRDHGVEFHAEADRPVTGMLSLVADDAEVAVEHEVDIEGGETLFWALTMGSLARA
jgi:hypothetical protein